jgi:hypothetical protein
MLRDFHCFIGRRQWWQARRDYSPLGYTTVQFKPDVENRSREVQKTLAICENRYLEPFHMAKGGCSGLRALNENCASYDNDW